MLSSSQIIESLIDLLNKYSSMVKKCFCNDVIFERARQVAFETFLNRDRGDNNRISMAEMLAAYTDTVLRKGGGS